YIHALDKPTQWPSAIPHLQFKLNNSKATSTQQAPNEVVKGFTPNDIVTTVHRNTAMGGPPTSRVSVHDALAIASMTMKHHYDRRHTTRFFSVGDRVMLRLHQGY
ncbi:hypothetical protein LY78DRAFT_546640, partial [Colletotrichum sublineola]